MNAAANGNAVGNELRELLDEMKSLVYGARQQDHAAQRQQQQQQQHQVLRNIIDLCNSDMKKNFSK